MDIYLTIEEKYLKAIDKISYGKSPKALQLLNDIIAADPSYGRAHYQLGKLYYYDMNDYQAAGYHFKTCVELEPTFPNVYEDYLRLLVFLCMDRQVQLISEKALTVPGVNRSYIHYLTGLHAEKKRDWNAALTAYNEAFLSATNKHDKDTADESIARIKAKYSPSVKYKYELSE
ncbi:MAG: tetratricopeptide repeat protein [Mucilaginibacter sp.]|jgi:tetratricopeptide (TPR) repeat protein